MEIAEFLLARIAEDEAVVAKLDRDWGHSAPTRPGPGDYLDDDEYDGIWVAPARVLAECEAKRRIVELHKPWYGSYECPTCADGAGEDHGEVVVDRLRAPCPTLRLLALPYAGHPDYQPEWSSLASL